MPQPVAGLYLGDVAQNTLLCPMSSEGITDWPEVFDQDELVQVAGEGLRFTIVLSEPMRELGVGPSSLRVLRVRQSEPRPEMRVIAMQPELLRGQNDTFALFHQGTLAEGQYHFGLERPGWTKGLNPSDKVMSFFGCAFQVVRPPHDLPAN